MKPKDATRATAETVPEISRRRFLLNTTIAGAAVAIAVPVATAEPAMTPRERAIWHMRELERLVKEDGGNSIVVQALAAYGNRENYKLLGIIYTGRLVDYDGMFAGKAVRS